jgi:hypothetical protein
MPNKLKTIFIAFYFCIPFLLFSQEELKLNPLNKLIQQHTTSFVANNHFKKARLFFFKKQWDSTLVHTAKTLNFSTTNQELIDYCLFFRGISFF